MIGIDIEEVKRFELEQSHELIQMVFTPAEQAYAYAHSLPAQHLAGIFCAKEAYRKCVGKTIEFTSVEVRHAATGKTIIYVKNKPAKVAVSISHTSSLATAIVVNT